MGHDFHRFAHEAMNTTFELAVADEERAYAQQAAQAVFDEIDRLERLFSRFVTTSDIARINNLGAEEPVRVNLETITCLRLAIQLAEATGGAFDVTRSGGAIALDDAGVSVSFPDPETHLDLGGIGKGFALDHVIEIIEDWGLPCVLLQGGESTVLATNAPRDEAGWAVGVGAGAKAVDSLPEMYLANQAISASGIEIQGEHIIDPRTGHPPATGAIRAWAGAPSAAVSDALSTAFMVMPPEEVEQYCQDHPETQALLLLQEDPGNRLVRFGNW